MPVLFNIRRKYARRGASERVNIAEATITLSANSFVYTGEAITPAVTVTYNGEVLELDRDYFLSYGDNTAIGRGYATVTGDGMYKGTARKYFYITAAEPEPTPGAWADFDLAKTVSDGGVSDALSGMNIQSICNVPNGISFVDMTSNKAFVYGFGSGERFNAGNLSRKSSMADQFTKQCGSLAFANEGRVMYVTSRGTSLSTAYGFKANLGGSYDPATIDAIEEFSMSPVEGKIYIPGAVAYFTDGTHCIAKNLNFTNDFNVFTLRASYDFTEIGSLGYNFGNYNLFAKTGETAGSFLYRGVCASGDGKTLLTIARNTSSLASYVVKFHMENAYEINNAIVHSVFKLPTIASADVWNAVCVNDNGTKMMVFGPEYKFRSFNLSE